MTKSPKQELREKIQDKFWDDHIAVCDVGCGYRETHAYEDAVELMHLIDEYVASLILGKKEIPEEVPLDGTYGGNWDDIWENGQDIGYAQGYNEAIEEIRQRAGVGDEK